MNIEIGKKEAKIIVWEIECSLRSILHYESRKEKGEFDFDNFRKFEIEDFVLEDAEMTESEYKTCIGLLEKCDQILNKKLRNSKQISTRGKK